MVRSDVICLMERRLISNLLQEMRKEECYLVLVLSWELAWGTKAEPKRGFSELTWTGDRINERST